MTNGKSSVVTDFVLPIGVLLLICIVMSALLAVTNGATAPIIEASEEQAKQDAMVEVMPDAPGFEAVDVTAMTLPESASAHVTEVYRASDGTGYVFLVTGNGYGGKNTLSMVVGIDTDGAITDTLVLSHSETVGLGAKITGDDFRSQFPAKTGDDFRDVDLISGATFSSNYYLNAVEAAFNAYNVVKEAA